MDAVSARDKAVEQAIARGDHAAALEAALANPPYGSKDEALKDANHAVVMKAVFATSEKKVPGVVEALFARWRHRVDFAAVYVSEAHARDGWALPVRASHRTPP